MLPAANDSETGHTRAATAFKFVGVTGTELMRLRVT